MALVPLLANRLKNLASREAMLKIQVGSRILMVATSSVERTSVRDVVEHLVKLVRLPSAKLVTSLAGNQLEDVGADVPSTQCGEVPVGLDGRDFRVVVVEVVVGGANKMLGNGITKEDTKNMVLVGIRLVLIPGDQDEGVVHKVLVLQERLQELAAPVTSHSNRGIMAVRGHVGSDEHPLGQLVLLEILVEQGSRGINQGDVLNLRQTLLRESDAVMKNGRVVLAHIVVGAVLVVHPREALETRVGHVLLVKTPRDTVVLEQVNDSRDIARVAVEVIVLHAKVVTSDGGHVVGLRRMSDAKVVGQGDALGSEPSKVGCFR